MSIASFKTRQENEPDIKNGCYEEINNVYWMSQFPKKSKSCTGKKTNKHLDRMDQRLRGMSEVST